MEIVANMVELRFPVRGDRIPVDHGYSLYSSLADCLERADSWVHEANDFGLLLVRGTYDGKGALALGEQSWFGVRTPADRIARFLPLAGKRLRIQQHPIVVGVPRTALLTPASEVRAHIVTTRNGHEEERFDTEIRRQMDDLGIVGHIERGQRRVFKVHGKKVVGHTLFVRDLSPEHSLILQERGLGGRRKMGCGVFTPYRREDQEV